MLITDKIKKYRKKVTVVFLIGMIALGIYYYYFDLNHLPSGTFIESLNSPNEQYTINSYQHSGGATTDWSVRVEIVNQSNHKRKNIYWKYHEKDVKLSWINNEIVEINGVKLNIHKDTYHWRRDK